MAWRLGASVSFFIAVATAFYHAGGVAQDIETNKNGITRNSEGRREMGRDVRALERANSASEATAQATADELETIKSGVKDNQTALQQNRAALSRIEGLLLGPSGNRP